MASTRLTAAEIGITDDEHFHLIGVRDDLAAGIIKHVPIVLFYSDKFRTAESDGKMLFHMGTWGGRCDSLCSTTHCIGSFMEVRGAFGPDAKITDEGSQALKPLFCPSNMNNVDWDRLDAKVAILAIDHFMSGAGEQCWALAAPDFVDKPGPYETAPAKRELETA